MKYPWSSFVYKKKRWKSAAVIAFSVLFMTFIVWYTVISKHIKYTVVLALSADTAHWPLIECLKLFKQLIKKKSKKSLYVKLCLRVSLTQVATTTACGWGQYWCSAANGHYCRCCLQKSNGSNWLQFKKG